MDHDLACRILDEHLEEFRGWSHQRLASMIDETRRKHDCLHAADGETPEGEHYFVEINVFWDDKPGGDLRVVGDLTSLTAGRRAGMFRWLPIITPDGVRSFVLTPDGTFIGE